MTNSISDKNDPCWKKLGRRYKRLRIKRGLAIEDAVRFGLSAKLYQQLESGKPHTLTTLFKLADMLGTSASKLVDGIFD